MVKCVGPKFYWEVASKKKSTYTGSNSAMSTFHWSILKWSISSSGINTIFVFSEQIQCWEIKILEKYYYFVGDDAQELKSASQQKRRMNELKLINNWDKYRLLGCLNENGRLDKSGRSDLEGCTGCKKDHSDKLSIWL